VVVVVVKGSMWVIGTPNLRIIVCSTPHHRLREPSPRVSSFLIPLQQEITPYPTAKPKLAHQYASPAFYFPNLYSGHM
jgi:hypothetical protein